jgi:hypothetical protein
MEDSPYFTQRLNEAQLTAARAEAEAIGEARGEARGVDRLSKLIKDGYDVDTAVKMIMGESSYRTQGDAGRAEADERAGDYDGRKCQRYHYGDI